MGRRTRYEPGTFSWVDLATTDPGGAAAFYGGLLGWELGGDGVFRLDGSAVAGLAPAGAVQSAGTAWRSHVTVADAEAAAARARGLGLTVVEGPATGAALVRDPQGALLALSQPGERIGADRVNDAGCLVMNELVTADPDAAMRAYAALFGWTFDTSGAADGGPVMVLNRGRENAAILTGVGPAHWRPCFTVADLEAAAARVRELGGELLAEPALFPDGHGGTAVARDPQGAEFSLFAGETEP
jgi:uncharacterized protein